MSAARNWRDIAAGAVLVLVAAALLWFGRDLPIGEATRLGPGYVPRILAVLIALFGIAIFVRAVLGPGEGMTPAKPLAIGIVLGAMLLFAFLLEKFGLATASVALLLASSIAAPGYRPIQSVFFAILLTIATTVLFVWGLGQNIRVLPW